MMRWSWLLAVALFASPAFAADKKDDKKKDDKKAPAATAAQQDPLAAAQEKLAAGNTEEAVSILDKAMATDGRAGLRLGELRETRGELDLAVDAYKVAAEKLTGAGKGEALGRMAVVQDTRGMAEAAASADAAVAADPEGVWPTIALSYRRTHEGKADEGVTLAQKAVAAGGGAGAKTALGHALALKGDLAGAEAAFREAMAADPKALGAVIGLAGVLRQTKRATEAEPMLKKVVEASPGAVEAYKELTRVKIALGRAQDALGDANIAAAMADNDPEAKALVVEVKVARALQALGEGQTDLALQDLTQLRDQNPDSTVVRLGLGRAQMARRDAAQALVELQKAVELDPKNAEAQYQLGLVQLMMKANPAGAVAPLDKAVALEPGNPAYLTSLGMALGGAQQLDRSIDVLTKATALPGYDKAEGFVALGQAYVQLKRYKDALPSLEKATSLAPDNAQVWATLGWAYFGLKDGARFKETAGKARSLGYKEPTLLSYLKRIEAGEPIK